MLQYWGKISPQFGIMQIKPDFRPIGNIYYRPKVYKWIFEYYLQYINAKYIIFPSIVRPYCSKPKFWD